MSNQNYSAEQLAERLHAIEDIKKLKSRYFQFLDNKEWDNWQTQVWAPDATLDVPELGIDPVAGADNIANWTAARMGNVLSIHHGHMPDIEILSDGSETGVCAKGVWAMEDILRWPTDSPGLGGSTYIHGWGHYHETYVRLAEGWRIKSSQLTRLYVERF